MTNDEAKLVDEFLREGPRWLRSIEEKHEARVKATAQAYAQAGFDAAVRLFESQGRLLPYGKTLTELKEVLRDENDRIVAVVPVVVQDRVVGQTVTRSVGPKRAGRKP